MIQNLRSGQLDILTPGEMSAMLHEQQEPKWSKTLRHELQGIKIMKLPRMFVNATATTAVLSSGNNFNEGPDAGFIWQILRINITCEGNIATDTSTWQLFANSDLQPDPYSFLDTITQGKAYYPSTRGLFLFDGEQLFANGSTTVSGRTYTMTGLVVEVPRVMQGKLFA